VNLGRSFIFNWIYDAALPWFGVYTKPEPKEEIGHYAKSWDGCRWIMASAVAAATRAHITATRDNKLASKKECLTNLLRDVGPWSKRIIKSPRIYLVRLKIQSLVADPSTVPEHDHLRLQRRELTMEEAEVREKSLLKLWTPTSQHTRQKESQSGVTMITT
jgi:hypothetical protein